MRRIADPLLLVLAACLLLAGAMLLWPEPEMAMPAAGSPASTSSGSDLWPAPQVAVGDEEPAAPGEEDAQPTNERTELVLPTGQVADGPGPTVLVLQGSPPRPVAGAVVAFVDRQEAHRRRERSGREVAEWDLPQTFGSVLHTEANGTVQLAAVVEPTLLCAASEQHFATALLRPGQRGVVRMLLQLDETLRLLVKDADGQPAAGVPVAVYQGQRFAQTNRLWTGRTGRDGLAIAAHFQLLRQPPRHGRAFCAVLPLPLAQPVAVAFEGRPAPAEPVPLQLPPTAALDVTLADPSGTPLRHPAQWTLQLPRPKKFSVPLPVAKDFDALHLDKPRGTAPLHLARLGLGLSLQPAVRLADDRREWQAAAITVPLQAGECAAVSIRLPDDYAVLAGRLCFADGRPAAADARAELTVLQLPIWRSGLYACGDGSFDLPVHMRGTPTGLQLAVRYEAGGQQPLGARLEVPALRPGQRLELGDVVLQELPPLCAGEVVDDAGAPVRNANVAVQVYGQRRDRSDWFDTAMARTRTDAGGRFAVIDHIPQGPWRLMARAGGHLPASSPEAPATDALRLVLMRLGIVRGSLRIPRWLPADALTMTWKNLAEPERPVVTVKIERRDGRFVVRDLMPGPYLVQLRLRSLPDPVFSIDGLLVQPGEQRDQRLVGLDLDNLLCRFQLHAVGPSGPLPAFDGPILARYTGLDGTPRQVGFRWQKGRAELITDSALVELICFGTGMLPRRVVLAPGEHNVYLQPLFPAVIRLPRARLLCGPDRKVRVSMICTEDTGLPQSLSGTDLRSGQGFSFNRWELGKSGGAWLGPDDVVEVPLSKNGKYEVVLRLYGDDDKQGQVSVRVGVVDVVLDGSGPTERSLQLDGNKIAQALQRLQQQGARGRRGR